MVDVEGVKTTPKIGGAKILLNILEIIQSTIFAYIDKISVFPTTNLMVYTVLQEKNLLLKEYIKKIVFLINFSK